MSQERDYRYKRTNELIALINDRMSRIQILVESIKKSLRRIEGSG